MAIVPSGEFKEFSLHENIIFRHVKNLGSRLVAGCLCKITARVLFIQNVYSKTYIEMKFKFTGLNSKNGMRSD